MSNSARRLVPPSRSATGGQQPVADRVGCRGSAVDEALHLLRVAVSLDLVVGGDAVEFAEIVARELNVRSAEVLLDSLETAGPGDRHDVRSLRQQPCQGDLAGRR